MRTPIDTPAACRRYWPHQLLLVMGLFTAGLAFAQHSHQAPAADSATAAKPTAAPAKAAATPVRKFATDDSLRQGMGQIAAAYSVAAADIDAGRFSSSAYRELAKLTEERIAFIVKNCKLEPQADQTLHYILHDLQEAIVLMRMDKLTIQRSGALAAEQTLRVYAQRFDHPGWSAP